MAPSPGSFLWLEERGEPRGISRSQSACPAVLSPNQYISSPKNSRAQSHLTGQLTPQAEYQRK